MATRTLEAPRDESLNVRVYDNNGALLAALEVPTNQQGRYVNSEMLYRYCSMIFIIPSTQDWYIFDLKSDGSIGALLRQNGRGTIQPGNYIVLDQARNPLTVNITHESAPRRVRTSDHSTQTQGPSERDRQQRLFRERVRARDGECVITGPSPLRPRDAPFRGLDATRIFPASQLSQWNRDGLRSWITDTSQSSEIGTSGLYSPQNGLLLSSAMHTSFDAFDIGVDPDADHKIVTFVPDQAGLGGRRLKASARSGTNPNNRVSEHVLRWHLRMCVLSKMKTHSESQPLWEEGLDEDNMGEILSQPDAPERMEAELFTRLGGMVA